MSRRRELESHRRSLDEIRDIMNAMKNLSYMETRKISSFLDAQHSVVKHIETVATDFLSFYPETLTEISNSLTDVYLLIGSERGFCGDFNHELLREFENTSLTHTENNSQLICIGHKLKALLNDDIKTTLFINGASVADEVNNVLNQIVNQLMSAQTQYGLLNLYVFYHNDKHQIISQKLLPPFQNLSRQQQEPCAPDINLPVKDFLFDLSYHYLFAILHEILYTSLMTESHQRLMHLDGAIQHMEEKSEELNRRSNVLRQEEIIEEIEVILLNAAHLNEPSFHG